MEKKLHEINLSSYKITEPGLRQFNPNYLTDYRAYLLGMSTEEIDKLLAYRAAGKFVNSAKQFQNVTGISDSLLRQISPMFKFPEWVNSNGADKRTTTEDSSIKFRDINRATAEDLRQISGIGNVLSQRIVKFRNSLGGFMVETQLYDVYGLDAEIAQRAMKKFKVMEKPRLNLLNINEAGFEELVAFVYFNYEEAEIIMRYRDVHGRFDSMNELGDLLGGNVDRIERIKLYLTL